MRTNTGQILYIPKIGQRADFQHPLMKGCVAWWPLTDGGGATHSELITSDDGTAVGTPQWKVSELGNVVDLDGSSDYVSFGLGTQIRKLTSASAVTASVWFNADSLPALDGTENVFVIYLSLGQSPFQIYLRDVSGTPVVYGVIRSQAGDAFTPNASYQISVGEWYHAVVVGDLSAGTSELYLNGVLVDNQTHTFGSTVFVDAGDQINLDSIGVRSALPDRYFDGRVQNARFWSRSLSSSEVLELYTNPWAGLSIPSSTRYFYFPTTLPLSETIGTFKMRNLSFTPKSGGRTIIKRGP